MSRAGRLGLIAAAIAVAVVALIVAQPGDDDDDDGGGTTATQQAQTTPEGETETAPPQPPPPRVERIRVRNGEPVGGVQEIEFDRGDTVRLAVTADVEDHVHVPGYDLFRDVAPGQTARFRFEADIEGIFEIELEDTHTPIAELRVEP
jgi:hypothetical protein